MSTLYTETRPFQYHGFLIFLLFTSLFSFHLKAQDSDFKKVKTPYEFKSESADTFQNLWSKDKDKAMDFLENAIEQARKNEDYETMVFLLEKQSNAYRIQKQDSLALIQIDKAIDIAKNHLGEDHMLLAKSYFRKGVIWHRQRRAYTAAVLFDSAQLIYASAKSYDSLLYKDIVDYKYYAYSYGQLSLDTLTKYLRERLSLSKATGKGHKEMAELLKDSPYLYMQKGDLKQALASAVEAASYTEQYKEFISTASFIKGHFSLILVLYQMDEYEKGLKICNDLLGKVNMSQLSSEIELQAIYNIKAALLIGLGRYSEAIDIYRRLLNQQTINSVDDMLAALSFRTNLAVCYANIDEMKLSQSNLKTALNETKNLLGYPNKESELIYRMAGSIYERNGDYKLSLSYYDSAVKNGIPSYSSENIMSFPQFEEEKLPLETLLALMDKTVALINYYENADQDNLDLNISAIEYAFSIDSLLIQNRKELIQAEGNLFLSRDFRPLYEAGIRASYYLYKNGKIELGLESASKFFALSKAVLLLEQAGDFEKIQNPRVPQNLKSEYYARMQEIENLSSTFNGVLDHFNVKVDTLENLSQRLSESSIQLMSLKDSISNFLKVNEYDDDFLIKRENWEKAKLRPNQARVEYFVGEEQIFILSSSKSKSAIYKIELDSNLIKNFETVINEISSPPQYENYDIRLNQFTISSYNLYKILLQPVLSEMGENINELVVIPDDFLSRLPFEVLITDSAINEKSFKNLKYLAKDYSVNYAFTSLKNIDLKMNRIAEKNLLGMGYSQSSSNMSSLPGTEKEIKFLQSKVEGDYYLGSESSKNTFVNFARDYDILHLAIHGIADTSGQYNSKLIFNGSENNTLRTNDLYLAGLQARLAVLSACESGLGKINKGEGAFSIARGFILVGVPSVVMSLWSVNDRITSDLMVNFHSNLNEKNLSVDEALAQTKKEYLQTSDNYTSHPYFWAAFITLGSPIKIREETSQLSTTVMISLFFVFFMLLSLFLRYKKRKASKLSF